jgi:GH15 family glucan-1,4-alpha-glucosidase
MISVPMASMAPRYCRACGVSPGGWFNGPMNPDAPATSTPLEDYALLSDLRTGPLVSRDGSIDWLCFPRFDSPSVFAALLGTEEDGRWQLSVVDGRVVSRQYLPRTFVLETTWRSPAGVAVVTDFMPPSDGQADLVRRVECLSGAVEVEHDLRIRFDYNRAKPWTRRVDLHGTSREGLLSVAGPDALLLAGPLLHPHEDQQVEPQQGMAERHEASAQGHPDDHQGAVSDRLTGIFGLQAGESVEWVLTWHESHRYPPTPVDPAAALKRTVAYWRDWSAHVEVHDRHDQKVLRSLMVLRALTHQATGGIVAAATASLPEDFGGARNWDYRYTWLRDAALTIETLIGHDFTEGALHWRDWLLRAVAGDPQDLQIMYGIAGERQLPETTLDHLTGYEHSTPVRIGNEAAGQYQADVVGEVMIALAALRDAGVPEDEYSWGLQKNLLRFCEENFDRPGHGIWEMRGAPGFFVHGRAMMWAAFNEGIRAVDQHGLDGPVTRWRGLREKLHGEILDRGFNRESNCFTQTYGNTEVDASLLQLPHTGLVAYDDPRMLGTVARIEQDLMDDSGLVRRYRTEAGLDGLPGDEYPFLICSFWLVEQYARTGRVPEATALLDQLVGYATDLGLYAEEYDPTTKRLAGNFPQAFSHLGFIRATDALEEATGKHDLNRTPRTRTGRTS